MHSREQYLATMREEYRRASKKQKTKLLNEARRRTKLNRKVLIRKLAHPATAKREPRRRTRKRTYGAEIKLPLVQIWEIFDFPCGTRLEVILKHQVDRLRGLGELRCNDEVAAQLKQVSGRTIDRLLAHERKVRCLKRKRRPPVHPLLYQRVPVKMPSEWNRQQVGNLQGDFVLHCGASAAGHYAHTLSVVDIATGWWEGEPQMGRSQQATEQGLIAVCKRLPFRVREFHPDNDSALLNDLLWTYCRKRRIQMSRSRPYEKNDNAWVEQKNFTHVRKVVGYGRFDRKAEIEVLGDLYRALADFQNFFQPVMKLEKKVRVGAKVQRKYDEPKTPYERLLDSGCVRPAQKRELELRCQQLNPAELRRRIEGLRNQLFDLLESKTGTRSKRVYRRYGPSIELNRARNQRLRRMKASE